VGAPSGGHHRRGADSGATAGAGAGAGAGAIPDSIQTLNPGLGGGPPGGGVTTVSTNAVPSGPGIDGTLTFINNQVDTATGTVLLKATFENASGALWPGEFVLANLHLTTQQDALVVPVSAVMTGQQGVYVFVVDPKANTVQQRPVVVGRTTTNRAVISSGLAEGDEVVTDGQSRLQNGSKVTVRAIASATPPSGTMQ
jgi:RND family efflux transporter MFP subunit